MFIIDYFTLNKVTDLIKFSNAFITLKCEIVTNKINLYLLEIKSAELS
jgi:hypothetical protein